MAPDSFTPEAAQAVLDTLNDGTCPFVRIAGERCGLSRGKVENWVLRGERDCNLGLDTPLSRWFLSVRQAQGKWKADAMRDLESADKDTRDAAANKRWLLERLDRETFDISRPAKHAPKGESEKPATPNHAADLKSTIEDLEKPENQLQ